MVAIPSRELSPRRDGFRELLESNYQKRNLVHLTAGSVVPLLKNSIWLVVRGMVKLGAVSVHGDELLLGLAGPNEPFGEPLSTVEAYEAVVLSDCDLLCMTTSEVEQSPQLATRDDGCHRGPLPPGGVACWRCWVCAALRNGFGASWSCWLRITASPVMTGLRLNVRLTHQEIASALSTTRVTVTRVIGLLRDEGWLKIDPQRHLVIAPLPRR